MKVSYEGDIYMKSLVIMSFDCGSCRHASGTLLLVYSTHVEKLLVVLCCIEYIIKIKITSVIIK